MIYRRVMFSVKYETIIAVESEADIEDAASDVTILEDNQTRYISDTFEVDAIQDASKEEFDDYVGQNSVLDRAVQRITDAIQGH